MTSLGRPGNKQAKVLVALMVPVALAVKASEVPAASKISLVNSLVAAVERVKIQQHRVLAGTCSMQ